MPHLKACNLDPFFVFEPLHERIHLMAMRSFRSSEFKQIKFFFHSISSFHV
jgi:hypothetical protein